MQQSKIVKKANKTDRAKRILLALVEYYIRVGKPVASNTLKETGIDDLSPATIRNYFAKLEENGFLHQQHTSGGRIPTHSAFRLYAREYMDALEITPEAEKICNDFRLHESHELAFYLQTAAETLSTLTKSAVFVSAPRFDHDFITMIKLVSIDHLRTLCIIVTDFGVIKTEIVQLDQHLSAFSIKRLEEYFHSRLKGQTFSQKLEKNELELAQKLYSELMVRYIVGYSNFSDEEIYRTGFSKLLAHAEFHDPAQLTSSLSLFENSHSMRLLLKECTSHNTLKVWIGDDFAPYTSQIPHSAILAIPYSINKQPIGAIGLLNSIRIPYRELIALLHHFADTISANITHNIYKFKIKYRQPQQQALNLQQTKIRLLEQAKPLLLEDKR